MQMDSNIDRNDAVYNTNAPFEGDRPLVISGFTLDYRSFRSIRVYVTETMTPPVRLASITLSKIDPDKAYARFEASNGVLVGRWEIVRTIPNTTGEYVTCFILNDADTIMGHVVYAKSLPDALLHLVSSAGGTVNVQPSSFKLLPQCHVPMHVDGVRAFKVGSHVYRGELVVSGVDELTTTVDDNMTASIGLNENVLPYKYKKHGICKLKVDNLVSVNGVAVQPGSANNTEYWIGGSHLILRSSVTSNLRVSMENGTIALKGVQE